MTKKKTLKKKSPNHFPILLVTGELVSQVRVVLGRKLYLPQIVQFSLRPDQSIGQRRPIGVIPLMVPWINECVEDSEKLPSYPQFINLLNLIQ